MNNGLTPQETELYNYLHRKVQLSQPPPPPSHAPFFQQGAASLEKDLKKKKKAKPKAKGLKYEIYFLMLAIGIGALYIIYDAFAQPQPPKAIEKRVVRPRT